MRQSSVFFSLLNMCYKNKLNTFSGYTICPFKQDLSPTLGCVSVVFHLQCLLPVCISSTVRKRVTNPDLQTSYIWANMVQHSCALCEYLGLLTSGEGCFGWKLFLTP